MKTVIITDSTCDLSKQAEAQLDVKVIPLTVHFEGKSYLDGIEITKEEFFAIQAESDKMPTTSQPNPQDFEKMFSQYLKQGCEIVFIGISSKLSGTMQSANIAKNALENEHIYLVDSTSASLGTEALVRLACNLRGQGASALQIAQKVSEKTEKLKVYAVIDTLKYLVRGGRLSKTAGVIGGALGLKPILTVSDGVLSACAKARGQQNAFETITQLIKSHSLDSEMPIVLTHANDSQNLSAFVEYLHSNGINYLWNYAQVGSVIGTHTGPGCVGIAFFEK